MLRPPRPFSRRLFLDFVCNFFPQGPLLFLVSTNRQVILQSGSPLPRTGRHIMPSPACAFVRAAHGHAIWFGAQARPRHLVRSPSATASLTRHDQDHGASAARITRHIDSNMSSTIARVLALHVPFVCVCACACFAPIFAYLVLVCACVNLFVLSDKPYLHACVVLARAIWACVPCSCLHAQQNRKSKSILSTQNRNYILFMPLCLKILKVQNHHLISKVEIDLYPAITRPEILLFNSKFKFDFDEMSTICTRRNLC